MRNRYSLYIACIIFCFYSCAEDEVPNDVNTEVPICVTCTNTLSDASMINEAIAKSHTGAEILIIGECLIDQTIKLLGDRAYRGESLGTIIKQADDANLVALLASDSYLDNTNWTGTPVSIRQITLDGNKAMNTQVKTAGIVLRSWLSSVENVQITSMGGDGILVSNLSLDGTELNTSQVNGRISGNFITGSGRYGIFVEDTQNAVTDWILTDNWVAQSGKDGIHLDNAAGWMITRNHVYGVPQNAIYAHRLWGSTISDNYIEGFGETTITGNYHGIYATGQGNVASTIFANRIFNFWLENAEINAASSYRYIYFKANYDTALVSLVGNTIKGAHSDIETGMYLTTNTNAWLKATLSGNLIDNIENQQFIDDHVSIIQ